jgi:hypothetical protein
MTKLHRFIPWLLMAMLVFTSCRQEPASLPTTIPTAAVPATVPVMLEETATIAGLPPTRDLATATRQPTPVLPTRAPIDTPTPVIGPIITLDEPLQGQQFTLGESAVVSGFAQVGGGMNIQVGLTSASGLSLAATTAEVEGNGWRAELPIPDLVTGVATIQAVILDAGGNELSRAAVPVELVANRQNSESFVSIFRPEGEAIAVAGHNLFVDGQLWREGGGNLQVAALVDGCSESVANLSFQLSTSSTWQGFLVLPRDISGPACVVAWVGQQGEDEWRAAQVPVMILDQSDAAAEGIMIANPAPGRRVRGGETFLFNGIAYNVPGQMVTLRLQFANGEVIGEAEDDADTYGYWSTEVTMPPVAEEREAVLTVFVGDEVEPEAQTEVTFTVVPAN